jgi:hypothetical protein
MGYTTDFEGSFRNETLHNWKKVTCKKCLKLKVGKHGKK